MGGRVVLLYVRDVHIVFYLDKNSSYEHKVYVFYTSHPKHLTPQFLKTFKMQKKKTPHRIIKEFDALAGRGCC